MDKGPCAIKTSRLSIDISEQTTVTAITLDACKAACDTKGALCTSF